MLHHGHAQSKLGECYDTLSVSICIARVYVVKKFLLGELSKFGIHVVNYSYAIHV